MSRIQDILKHKSHHIVSASPEDSVFKAIQLMSENNIGSLLILDDHKKLLGIITEKDYARKIILQGRASKETPIREIMTRDILYVNPEQTVEECMAIMTEKRIRHLPVLEGKKLVGIVSIGDLVKAIIEHQKFIIAQLENYLHN